MGIPASAQAAQGLESVGDKNLAAIAIRTKRKLIVSCLFVLGLVGIVIFFLSDSSIVNYHDALGASFSPDGTRIVTAGYDKTARVWDAATGKALGEPLRHKSRVWSAEFNFNATRIVTSSNGAVRVWVVGK